MPVTIRQALSSDAPAIAAIIRACFPDDTVDAARIATVLRLADHVTPVAVVNDQPVGFLAGFSTRSAHESATGSANGLRWELDLLGVHPDWRGQGIATQLVSANTDAGREAGATLARGLVRVGNTGAELAFNRAGYSVSSETYKLFVATEDMPAIHPPSTPINLVPVQTLTYSGLWLEDELMLDYLLHANAERIRRGLDVVGVVIPAANPAAVQSAHDARYLPIADYRWWIKPFDLNR